MFEGSEARAVRVVVGGRIITLGTGSLPTTVSWLLLISREHYLPIRSQPSVRQLGPADFSELSVRWRQADKTVLTSLMASPSMNNVNTPPLWKCLKKRNYLFFSMLVCQLNVLRAQAGGDVSEI